jgi:hypothetical protein
MPRTVSVPVPSIGRVVHYYGYAPNSDHPQRMLGTVIDAPEAAQWDTPVTLEVTTPKGDKIILYGVKAADVPDEPQMSRFVWPRPTRNQDVEVPDAPAPG